MGTAAWGACGDCGAGGSQISRLESSSTCFGQLTDATAEVARGRVLLCGLVRRVLRGRLGLWRLALELSQPDAGVRRARSSGADSRPAPSARGTARSPGTGARSGRAPPGRGPPACPRSSRSPRGPRPRRGGGRNGAAGSSVRGRCSPSPSSPARTSSERGDAPPAVADDRPQRPALDPPGDRLPAQAGQLRSLCDRVGAHALFPEPVILPNAADPANQGTPRGAPRGVVARGKPGAGAGTRARSAPTF